MYRNLARVATQSLERRRRNLLKTLDMPRLYLTSYYRSQANRALFDGVKAFCFFVGQNRTGGSLVSGLLDAHPNAVFADEMDALRFVQAGFNRAQVFQLALENSQRWARQGRMKKGRNGKPYSYLVPGGLHGRSSNLRVIGDHKAGISTHAVSRRPGLLGDLRRTLRGADLKIIHVARNPYDMISTMMLKGNYWTLNEAIVRNAEMCRSLCDLWASEEASNMLLVRNDELIGEPKRVLREVCEFLAIPADEEYLSACAGIIYRSPSKSRNAIRWPAEAIAAVKSQLIDECDFLRGYSYED